MNTLILTHDSATGKSISNIKIQILHVQACLTIYGLILPDSISII